ncbi:MAG: polysaccharide biosynthesis tyrosine autokinase, partial [Bacteroidetes bacterium]|nr:polysaccharide biosynthesis tyrosine autokinase [Bacteroidota bacterium]
MKMIDESKGIPVAQDTPVNYIEVVRSTVRAYWPLYLSAALVMALVSFLFLRYTSPTFQVTAKILIKDEKKTGVGGGASSLISELDLFGGKKIVENELEILKSRPIVEKVVKNTHCNVHIVRNGRIRDVLENLDFPVQFTPLFPDSTADIKQLLHFEWKDNAFVVNGQAQSFKNDTLVWMGRNKSEAFQIVINRNRMGECQGEDYYITTLPIQKEVKNILEGLTLATTNKNTSVIALTFETKNKQRGQKILNDIIDAYAHAAIDDKREIAEFTLDFIEDRLSLVTSQLDSVERDIETFKESNSIVDLSQQGKLFLESVRSQDEELNKIAIQLSVVRDVENYVNGKSNSPGNLPSLVGITDPILNTLLPKLYDLEFAYNKRKNVVGDRDEQLVVMEEEMRKLRTNIRESVTQTKHNLEISQGQLKTDVQSKLSTLTSLPGKERMLLDISRQQAIKNSIYTFLLEKREESAISFASTVSDVRVVEPAEGDIDPVRPNRMLVIFVSLLLSILLPSVYIYYREVLTGKIKFRSDIESRTKLSVLGEVLQGEVATDFIISSDNRSPVAESLRSVRSKMSYYLTGEGCQVVLLSSCLPGEGKSFITTNLGLSLALMGKKTIVIAADMRKPRLHKAFGVQGSQGLSKVLIGQMGVAESIVSTNFQNLHILPPGPIPPNPAELLLNGRFKELIAELRTQYDYILIDTPPLGLISDAEIMADHADLSLFVVRHDHSLKEAVGKILGPINADSKFWPSAIVFNGLKGRGMSRYSDGGYGYGG